MNENKPQACIPFFVHENTMMHYNHANHRMLIACEREHQQLSTTHQRAPARGPFKVWSKVWSE